MRPLTPERAADASAQLGYAAIGRKLGCSRQCAHALRHRGGAPVPPALVRCRECAAVFCEARQGMWATRHALRLKCLAQAPDAGFGQRVLACRLSRGLTCEELAARVGAPTDAAHVGLLHQRRGLKRLPGLLLSVFLGS